MAPFCSKTFTTLETLANANAARHWLLERLGDQAANSPSSASAASSEPTAESRSRVSTGAR
jgi:glucose-6-phosphate isomerase